MSFGFMLQLTGHNSTKFLCWNIRPLVNSYPNLLKPGMVRPGFVFPFFANVGEVYSSVQILDESYVNGPDSSSVEHLSCKQRVSDLSPAPWSGCILFIILKKLIYSLSL